MSLGQEIAYIEAEALSVYINKIVTRSRRCVLKSRELAWPRKCQPVSTAASWYGALPALPALLPDVRYHVYIQTSMIRRLRRAICV
jgi:hypothetical protein